jgi:mRNA-decapping enzyme subunit 2
VNLPREELESVERICFQVEEAQWFYEDFIRPLDPSLPSMNLRQFCLRIFQHCPLFSGYDAEAHSLAFSEFLAYKTRVPVRGAIMLNEAMDQVVLVKGWKKSASWSFPRGKINKDEKDLDCAIREVYEETGYDLRTAGLIEDEDDVKSIEVTMREQHMRLYVFPNVPMDTYFEPRTRKEISKIEWYKLTELPTVKKLRQQQQNGGQNDLAIHANKFYMVAPFLLPLKKIISQRNKLLEANASTYHQGYVKGGSMSDALVQPVLQADQPIGNMNRLLAQLRQSQPAPPITLPQNPSTALPEDATTQLKHLLNVPIVGTKRQVPPQSSKADKAGAMLSMLRSGGSASNIRNTHHNLPPETPFDQIVGTPNMPPPSPKAHNLRHEYTPDFLVQRASNPPAFHFPPQQMGRQIVFHNVNVENRGSVSELGPQSMLHKNNVPAYPMPRSSQLPISIPVPAPYQRTGDPQFSQNPQVHGQVASAIPPASKLPAPRLNPHASSLLDLFKTGPSVPRLSQTETASTAAQNLSNIPRSVPHRFEGSSTFGSSTGAFGARELPAVSHPSSDGRAEPVKATSDQAKTLLSLFKSPTVNKPSPALVPAPAPVELSAQSSIPHGRPSSKEIKDQVSKVPQSLVNGNVTIQKRAGTHLGQHASLSATVTGPLNVPQFEKILKKATHKRETTPTRIAPTLEQPKPISILARPTKRADGVVDVSDFAARKATGSSPRRQRGQSVKETVQSPDMPPFQPQILKRPALLPDSLTPSTSQSVERSPSYSHQTTQTIQTQQQREALLSLFSKPKADAPNDRLQTPNTVISPLSMKVAMDTIVFPSPLPRSRLSSLHKPPTVENTADPRKASKTPLSDKQFLLGYLEGIAREGGK